MKMNMPVLVLKEGVVEMVGRKNPCKSLRCHLQLAMQIEPLDFSKIRYRLRVPIQGEKALSQEVLVHVDNELPAFAREDNGTQ